MHYLRSITIILGAIILNGFGSKLVLAAEKIVWRWPPFGYSTTVSELELYKNSKDPSRLPKPPLLAQLLGDFVCKNWVCVTPRKMTAATNLDIYVESNQFIRYLNSPGGDCVLRHMAKAVRPKRSKKDDKLSLRNALYHAASDGIVNPVEAVKEYPQT